MFMMMGGTATAVTSTYAAGMIDCKYGGMIES
jgi:hypothetical protein